MARFGKQRFSQQYQSFVGMGARPALHENSKELASILKETGILEKINSIFELGSGPGRNLHYINELKPELKLLASDLYKEHSLKYMHESIKNKIDFIEGDSELVIDSITFEEIDLLLVSDHFMHLQYEKVEKIFNTIKNEDPKPKYIMLRELRKRWETPDHPRLYHGYKTLLEKYNLILSKKSKQDEAYFIWLLELK